MKRSSAFAACLLLLFVPVSGWTKSGSHEQCRVCRATCKQALEQCRADSCKAEGVEIKISGSDRSVQSCREAPGDTKLSTSLKSCKSVQDQCDYACFDEACNY